MKVLNLHCAHGHVFEGWFANEDDFQSQQAHLAVMRARSARLGLRWHRCG